MTYVISVEPKLTLPSMYLRGLNCDSFNLSLSFIFNNSYQNNHLEYLLKSCKENKRKIKAAFRSKFETQHYIIIWKMCVWNEGSKLNDEFNFHTIFP